MKELATINSSRDVIAFLKQQHQQVKGLFSRVLATRGKQRQEAFFDLRRLMAIHETAEEEIVHPAARRAKNVGEAVVAARLREENEAKRALAELENLDVNSPEFEARFRTLETAVLAHANAEEEQEFDKLADELPETELQKMRTAVQFAESIAPTRPHPGIESATANALVGPFATLVDRARDALSKHM